MKILPVPLIRQADAYTIIHEPVADIDLMERAAGVCFEWLKAHLSMDHKIKVFCGAGNNGGDGLAIARMMLLAGFQVDVYLLSSPEKMSDCCKRNYERMQDAGYGLWEADSNNLPEISPSDVVLDTIFGSGLTRQAEGFTATVIHHINLSGAMVIAIDVPSGLFCDTSTHTTPGHLVVHADYTLTFAPPKLAFFFPENDQFIGNWQLLDIGLSRDFINLAKVKNYTSETEFVAQMLRKRNKFAHKGVFGHALIIAGSTGKMGAAILSARGCLRSGAGLVTVQIPGAGAAILQAAVPEAMLSIDPT